jgi:hypothetical protein
MEHLTELHQQIHKITELNNVLSNLLSDRALCDSEITNEIFFRYIDAVKEHHQHLDNSIYTELLDHADAKRKRTANQFMSGDREIKRIFNDYVKKWCTKGHQLKIKNFTKFQSETQDMFEIVMSRLLDETEKLYPLLDAAKTEVRGNLHVN